MLIDTTNPREQHERTIDDFSIIHSFSPQLGLVMNNEISLSIKKMLLHT